MFHLGKHFIAAAMLTLTVTAPAAPAALADEARRVVIPPELSSIRHPGSVYDLAQRMGGQTRPLGHADAATHPDLSNVIAGGPVASTPVGPDLSHVVAGGPGGTVSTPVGPDLSHVVAGGPGGIDATTLGSARAGESGGLDWRALLAGAGAGLGFAALAAAVALARRSRRAIAHP